MANAIVVVADRSREELSEITFEMLGIGRSLADAQGATLYAVVCGKGADRIVGLLGVADRVIVARMIESGEPGPATTAGVLAHVIADKAASLVLIGGTNASMGVASSLSARCGLPVVNFCTGVSIAGATISVSSQLFGGKILAEVPLPDGRGIVVIQPGSFPAAAGRKDRSVEVEDVEITMPPPGVVFRRYIEPEAGDVDITRQDILVSIGRGIQNADNVSMADELADALGGAVCASRPVIDQGWMPLSRQVGKSGMMVRPKLYLSLGVSGAPEHTEGMKDSDLIIAVNTDPNAPIFRIAHFGVCGDHFDIVPVLTEAIARRKESR